VVEIADCVEYSKIGQGRGVVKDEGRTHERERMGGSQRSEGHG
jgi:hypothetical protein